MDADDARRWFPLLLKYEERRNLRGPTTSFVPWDMLQPHDSVTAPSGA